MTALTLYRGLSAVAAPLIRLVLAQRLRAAKEDPARYGERFGIPGRPRPSGPLVWLHAASVGESLSVLALIERLAAERPAVTLLVTTGTVTSARLMQQRLPAGALHQYAPLDRLPWIRRFLDHWQPALALWIESEFWPNMLAEISARRVPLILVNARVSTRSFKGWRRFSGTIRTLLDRFDLCLPQTGIDRERLIALGASRIGPTGNLKFAAEALPADARALAGLREALGNRPCWLAASTHPGEEDVIAAAHRLLAQRLPRLITIIVPRHPGRGPQIAQALGAAGLSVALRSTGAIPGDATAVYVADTVGELGLFYRLAPVAFIGGSLIAHGGQNLLEPAKLGCAVVHGPDMANFAAIVAEMSEAGATEIAGDAAAIAAAIGRLLTDDALRTRRTAAAALVAEHKAHILDTVMTALDPWLSRLEPTATPGDTVPAVPRHARA